VLARSYLVRLASFYVALRYINMLFYSN